MERLVKAVQAAERLAAVLEDRRFRPHALAMLRSMEAEKQLEEGAPPRRTLIQKILGRKAKRQPGKIDLAARACIDELMAITRRQGPGGMPEDAEELGKELKRGAGRRFVDRIEYCSRLVQDGREAERKLPKPGRKAVRAVISECRRRGWGIGNLLPELELNLEPDLPRPEGLRLHEGDFEIGLEGPRRGKVLVDAASFEDFERMYELAKRVQHLPGVKLNYLTRYDHKPVPQTIDNIGSLWVSPQHLTPEEVNDIRKESGILKKKGIKL